MNLKFLNKTKSKQSQLIGKVLSWLTFVLLAALLILAYAMRDSMNNYVSGLMQQQTSPEITASGEALVDSLYNYTTNGERYELTFLEFGAKGCSACKRMEKVLEEVREKYPQKVKVVLYNVLKPEGQDLMKLYGIAAIPTQVLLDKNGKEYFRHTGYIATGDLEKEFNSFRN